MQALEAYKEKHGQYPSPRKARVMLTIDGQEFDASGALMLYQAIRGDGNDMIDMRGPSHASDGVLEEAEVADNLEVVSLPRSAVQKSSVGYILVDGYGQPFQYSAGTSDSVNPSYDLWSFGAEKQALRTDKSTKQDAKATAGWIKNW